MKMKEKLRGVYQTIICLICGKTIPTNPEVMSFVCKECETEASNMSCNYDLYKKTEVGEINERS